MVMLYGFVEALLVKEDPGQYRFINQGCLGVDGMDDREEMRLVDVCIHGNHVITIATGIICLTTN